MSKKSRDRRRLGTLAFFIGFAVGVWLMGGLVWAGLEASLFDPDTVGERLPTLRCSLIITPDEPARASVTLDNPLDRPIKRLVRWRMAQRHILLMEQEREGVAIEPGQRITLARELSAEAGVYGGRVLMTSVFVGSAYPLPAMQGNCGTWILRVPLLKGQHILILATLIALLGMGLGLTLRYRTRDPEKSSEGALAAILALFIIGMLTRGLLGWWAAAGLAELLMLLIMAVWLFQRIDERWLQVKPPIPT